MTEVFICDSARTAVGRYGGSLSAVRTDDLAAVPLKSLLNRNPKMDWEAVNDVLMGCVNQAGEDSRNVARMALLLAGLPEVVAGSTINRLCGSGLNAIGNAARAIKAREANLLIAGGVESMSRAPFVVSKSSTAFSRNVEIFDTTIGWRFTNKIMEKQYGTASMPETAENVAQLFRISRDDQDKFAFWSQTKAYTAQTNGWLAEEITPVSIPQRKGDDLIVELDEHPRRTTLKNLSELKTLFGGEGTVTAGNAAGLNDGAAAMILASEKAIKQHGLQPRARILGMDVAGVAPRIMGVGPVDATNKLLKRLGLSIDEIEIIELNEAFAAQALACTRLWQIADDDPRINPQGGAIALGHPLGMSGARLVISAVHQLHRSKARLALCTMCVGVGQGISLVLEKV